MEKDPRDIVIENLMKEVKFAMTRDIVSVTGSTDGTTGFNSDPQYFQFKIEYYTKRQGCGLEGCLEALGVDPVFFGTPFLAIFPTKSTTNSLVNPNWMG